MMTKLVISLLAFGLFAIQTAGHMNSDPAPGRSPGPPQLNDNNNDHSGSQNEYMPLDTDTVNNNNNNSSSSNSSTSTASSSAAARVTVDQRLSPMASLPSTSSTNNGFTSDINFAPSKSTKILQNEQQIDSLPHQQPAEQAKELDIPNSFKATKAPTPSSVTHSRQPSRAGCHEPFEEQFLNDIVLTDEDDVLPEDIELTEQATNAANAATNKSEPPLSELHTLLTRLRIHLQLEHDSFDTASSLGLTCGLLYKVRLTTSLTTHPPAALSGASPTDTQHGKHYAGEFFVESLSDQTGQERGSFLTRSLSNRLPISWLNALYRNDGLGPANAKVEDAAMPLDWFGAEDEIAQSQFQSDESNSELEGDYDDAEDQHHMLPAPQSPPPQSQADAFTMWHTQEEEQWSANSRAQQSKKSCPDNKWRGHVKSQANALNGIGTEMLNFWLVNELCEQDDVVRFRVFFRVSLRSNDSNVDGQNVAGSEPQLTAQNSLVFRRSFTFKLHKDCHMMLREANAGVLDYTMLPLYSIDCTVHFPSYRHLRNTAAASDTAEPPSPPSPPPPGILMELQRLNVPCASGGYVRFNERATLCGKLEELPASERSYHFAVERHTSVRLFKNPMFSVRYKLVDYCYNVTTSNQTGEFYVRPSMRDALECFFRIHLPYGNRVLLRLVANNDTQIQQPSMSGRVDIGGFSDDDTQTIYTELGLSIDTQIINLTLSGAASAQPSPLLKVAPYFRRSRTNGAALRERSEVAGGLPSHLNANSYAFLVESNVNLLSMSTNGGNAGDGSATPTQISHCNGIIVKVYENNYSKWTHCINSTRQVHGFIIQSSGNVLSIHLYKATSSIGPTLSSVNPDTTITLPTVYLSYRAHPIAEVVSNCAFGWVGMQQFCVAAIEMAYTWQEAEQHCVRLGGHLVSIRNDLHQQIINELLLHSPGYHDQNAYWVGGSDKSYEGDFRWSDGLLFQYTNWFAGWPQHGQYNKQPNDDGLSSQDCIELRRYFRTPPGIQTTHSPLASTFKWNDRDCSAQNFLICERPMSDESLQRNWINDCNKTVSLTKEHPRASIWSPSFPRQYPDNANCYTTITAPAGYRIVIEFEELVIENEPGCTYDYLEITEPSPSHLEPVKPPRPAKYKNVMFFDNNSNANSDSKNNHNNGNSGGSGTSNNNNEHGSRKGNSAYDYHSSDPYTSVTGAHSSNSGKNNNDNDNNIYPHLYPNANESPAYQPNPTPNSYNNFKLAQSNYQKLLHIFANLYKPHSSLLIQTPDYPKGNPYYGNSNHHLRSDDVPPKRLCGDWSSKLKLLRHVSAGSYVGLHFVSDYSHHFGGYKAKAYMENTASECANERLKPYNGSCYLFVSYPEVDWGTAQRICHAMGAKLTSVSSADEHRFITSNIRNQIDYLPQIIYWLGAELEQNGQFEWTDDTKMSFQGWLPGQGQFETMPMDATCLGLQYKMSPTPMLPSGLYWQSQKCNKVGGYVCKKPKETFGKYAFSNFTITGTEGRLISPTYPNTYPLNIDYWVHIKAPERTRIIVQFQKIDLEAQDECLYDYVSIQDYDLNSKIILEPGTNPQPMAMFASEDKMFTTPSDASERSTLYAALKLNYHGRGLDHVAGRQRRSARRKRSLKPSDWHELMRMSHVERGNRKTKHLAFEKSPMEISIRWPHWHRGQQKHDVGHTESKLREHLNERRRKRRDTDFYGSSNGRTAAPASAAVTATATATGTGTAAVTAAAIVLGDSSTKENVDDNAQSFLPYVRWCGSHESNMSKFDFVSSSNQILFNFHSDYSVNGIGFSAVWKSIDVSGCPQQILTSREGNISSPNYPHFMLNNLNCAFVLKAPAGGRVWLEFTAYDLRVDAMLELDIGYGLFRPFHQRNHINEGLFVSQREQLRIQFRTGQHPRGRGFQANYRTVGQLERRERVINLSNNITGYLFQLNYPHDMPENVDYTQHLIAPFGDNILLELHGVEFSENGCPDNNILEVYDNYADNNGTKWQLCKFENVEINNRNPLSDYDGVGFGQFSYDYHREQQQQYVAFGAPPVYITSYLNTLHIRQRTTTKADNMNATVRIQWDNNYKVKLATGDRTVESCQPNPCQFNGKCVAANNGTNYCQCQGHYTGRFCGLNICELEPCVFGKCELTVMSFKCQCQPGYMGSTCEQKQRPCADNPCEGRGICFEKNGGFFCRCHAWWEGSRCERRMLRIPYKPLSERMLQEPFWLGLITVFVVLAVIGLVWCAKRHFPEKIEKLLAEEADRNRPPGALHGHHHHTSLREQLQFTTAIPQSNVNNAPGAQRSIFNRLGIRKPSILSLSSPNPISGGGGAAARTFSLDDLLRPPPRRSPSPRKKRNNSTPVKKNAAEKKQILQQLVSPAAAQSAPKVNLDELITLTENHLRVNTIDSESDLKETTFSENSTSLGSTSVARALIVDPKLEKKVTFARLLNKVSAEMSSGSEVDMRATRNSSAISLPTDIQFLRASSMPPSPCTNDIRSPHSTSSNQGSDSLSSSDLALTDFGINTMQNGGSASDMTSMHNNQLSGLPTLGMGGLPSRARLSATSRPKVSSADSILAMFRSFSATAAANAAATASTSGHLTSNASSLFISPSTTPTPSSPQDDAPGDDESSTSSMHTPVSFSSGAPDSPVYYRQTTIEVPVLDALNPHKSTNSPSSSTSSISSANLLHPPTILLEIPSNGINKCLSPIRELPTPIPSPALTPIMPRPQRSNSPIFKEDPLSIGDFSDDDDNGNGNGCRGNYIHTGDAEDDDDDDDDDDDKSDERTDTQISEKVFMDMQREIPSIVIQSDDDDTPTNSNTLSASGPNQSKQPAQQQQQLQQQQKSKQQQQMSPRNLPQFRFTPPMITIDVMPPTPEERAARPRDLVIPTLTVEQPSPTKNRHPMIIFPGSPPPQRASIGETSFMFPNKQQQKRLLKHYEKPTSLDYPFVPPMITITSNMSELESDTEPLSPATKPGTAGGLIPPNPVGMCYLSPFTMCTRADRTISESNLSSSGYSSMASPGPSRCGSSNPLCPNEMDDSGSGHSPAGLSLHMNLMNRRRNSALASCKENISNGKTSSSAGGSNTDQLHGHRPRSDSETFSDDILIESNDEGIGTDHVDEKLEDIRLGQSRLRHLDIFLEEDQVLIEVDEPAAPLTPAPTNTVLTSNSFQMAQLQLPSIVIQLDGTEKGLSPVSSRSESPLSDRASIGRFSPHFYGRKDQLPFTDSDGLYDFPSSDGKAGTSAHNYTHQRRSSSKKRERKLSKCSVTQSPTKQLDMQSKDPLTTASTNTPSSGIHICNKHCHQSHHHRCPATNLGTRKSPKRRLVNRLPVASSSSSSESLTSARELSARQLPRRLNSPNREKRSRQPESLSDDDVTDALLRRISPNIVKEDSLSSRPKSKIHRLRAIGNQIRFLRRLEKSIKTRERLASPSDSGPEENTDDMDSPQATSPLLQTPSPTKTRLALCRQKRLPSGSYGIGMTTAGGSTSTWKGIDHNLIDDGMNSDD